MTMARHAGLLPAFFVREAAGDAETECSAGDVAALLDPARLEIAARARLPVAASESAEIVAFRSPEEASDHVALIIGRRDANPPVVRSEEHTSELQSLMRISYAVFCLKKTKNQRENRTYAQE